MAGLDGGSSVGEEAVGRREAVTPVGGAVPVDEPTVTDDGSCGEDGEDAVGGERVDDGS